MADYVAILGDDLAARSWARDFHKSNIQKIINIERAIDGNKPILLFLYGFNQRQKEYFMTERAENVAYHDIKYLMSDMEIETFVYEQLGEVYHVVSILDIRSQIASVSDMYRSVYGMDFNSYSKDDKYNYTKETFQMFLPIFQMRANAHRIGISAAHWKEVVEGFVKISDRIIVLYQEPTDGVQYEVEKLKDLGRNKDTVIVTNLYFRHCIGRTYNIDLSFWLDKDLAIIDYFHLQRNNDLFADDGTFTGESATDPARKFAGPLVDALFGFNAEKYNAGFRGKYCVENGKLFEAEGNYVAALFWYLLGSGRLEEEGKFVEGPSCISTIWGAAALLAGRFFHEQRQFKKALACYNELRRLFISPLFLPIIRRDYQNSEKLKVLGPIPLGSIDLQKLIQLATQGKLPS